MEHNEEKIKSNIIILSDLKNYEPNKRLIFYRILDMERKKEESPNKSKEEIKKEIEKEIEDNINMLKKESIKYYQIDNEKNKELERKFNQIKLKVNFNSVPIILRDGKFYTISQGCFTMYSDKFYNKLLDIKLEKNTDIIPAIELDNKDLVFLVNNQLIIYRLKDDKYSLFQKIDENRAGYSIQHSDSGFRKNSKNYESLFIKEISGNRFICGSNYGFKIFALNEKNEYSIILLEVYHESIRKIYELDKDTFIFCSDIYLCGPFGRPSYNKLILDKIKIKEISKTEKEKKLSEINNSEDSNNDGGKDKAQKKRITVDENKHVIESLKYTCEYNEFFELSKWGINHYFSGEVILKDKYFLVGIDNNILLFDIFTLNQLKRYEILTDGIDNLYKEWANIKKWSNNTDNEFFINIRGNIFLFRLTDNNELKIIGYSYFNDILNLRVLNEKNNQFYYIGKEEKSFGTSNWLFVSMDEENNKNYNVYIF